MVGRAGTSLMGLAGLMAALTGCVIIPDDAADEAYDPDGNGVLFDGAGDDSCDGVDDDGDGAIDEDAGVLTFYGDADADGYGAPDQPVEACALPDGAADNPDDCDDDDAAINPDGTETCDGADEDCDASIDEGFDGLSTFYADADDDGFGDASSTVDACETPDGYVEDATDCDDEDAQTFPEADETCDDADNDCDEVIDEDAVDETLFYADTDEDGWGDPDASELACDAPDGTVDNDGDCDDDDEYIHPDANEWCDGVDNDCDDDTDEDGALDADTWYADDDDDGYGDEDDSLISCEQPDGYIEEAEDCDDDDEDIHPDGTESCNDDDDDCDGTIDEDATDFTTYYADADGDGYGDASVDTESCSSPSGYVADATDCDDSDATVSPGEDEVCDGSTDEDCDDSIDENTAVDASTWYADDDGDGYGDALTSTDACDAPVGFIADDSDCDDSDSAISPAEDETCDGADDEDCDGTVDESTAIDVSTWYIDSDSDGYGSSSTDTEACDQPSGYADNDEDCDDADSTINPDATEVCDSDDQDCDGATDEDASDATTWYADSDKDGYGDADDTEDACTQPTNYVSNDEDCDDGSASVNPGESETCSNATDDDCDDRTDEDCLGTNCGEDSDAFTTASYAASNGVLAAASDNTDTGGYLFDDYEFEATAGDEIGVHLHATAFDAEVEVLDDDCNLYDYDEDSARDTNSWLEFTVPSDGIYTIKVRGSSTTAKGAYFVEWVDLTTGIGNFCDSDTDTMDVVSSASDSFTEQLTSSDKTLLNSNGQSVYYDDVEFLLFYGDTITLSQSSSSVDPFLYLADSSCVSIDYDDNSGSGTDAEITYTITETGVYSAIPSEARAATGNYAVDLSVTW